MLTGLISAAWALGSVPAFLSEMVTPGGDGSMALSPDILMQAAREHGTPLFVYDADVMLQRYRDLYEFITWPHLRIYYAMKANYNVALLRLLKDAGAALDTVSPGEVHLAHRLGFPTERLLYTANSLTDAEMREVQQTGVLMNIGELSRLEKFGREFPGSRVCIRFNPDVVDGETAMTATAGPATKFGILMEDADTVRALADRYRLQVVGLHEHTGSGLTKKRTVYRSMRNLMTLATPERFPDLEFLDFGGGFKVPYRPDEERIDYRAMGAEITRLFGEFCRRYGRDLEMRFEPGKCIVAECGHLVVEVNTLKDNRGRRIAGCNSGFPQLIRPLLYKAYHHIVNLSNPKGPVRTYDVCGNICETGDRFAELRELPEIREGDLLGIQNAGAYCYSMGGVYNLRPMPSEVVVRDGGILLTRKGLTSEQLADQILGEST
jgi:diaminopimelate decarboxylase